MAIIKLKDLDSDAPDHDHDRNKKDSNPSRYGQFTVYRRLFACAPTQYRFMLLVGVIFSAAAGVVIPVMTLIFGHFVTVFTNFALGRIDPTQFMTSVRQYALYFVYLSVGKLIASYISMFALDVTATKITSVVRYSYVNSIIRQDITFHESSTSVGTASLALSTHCNMIQSGLSDKFALTVQCSGTVIAAFAVAFSTQWQLTLVTATIVPALIVGVGITAAFESQFDLLVNNAKARAATTASEILGSIRTVRALDASARLLQRYEAAVNEAVTNSKRKGPTTGVQAGLYMFVIYGAYALAFWCGIRLFVQGLVTTSGAVVSTLFAIIIGANAFAQLAIYVSPLLKIYTAALDLLEIIDRQPKRPYNWSPKLDEKQGEEPREYSEIIIPNWAVEFHGVDFSYPLRPSSKVLDRLSFLATDKQMMVLVGPSGSGKSTIVGLLEQWYDASAGEDTIGGIDTRDVPIEVLRRNIGHVQQEPVLFNASIFRNVIYGLVGKFDISDWTEEQKQVKVESACKLANAHEFISKLPKGYDTVVGDKGALISGGQKQRIAIARAIICDPKMLILDEATSALDPSSEKIVQAALDKSSRDRTTIVIAHRLSTIRNANKIVVLKNGSIKEEGTHEHLAQLESGIYAEMLARAAATSNHTQVPIDHHQATPEDTSQRCQPNEAFDQPLHDSEAIGTALSKRLGFVDTIKRVMEDQRDRSHLYLIWIAACILAGAPLPLQAYLYAQMINVFQLMGSAITTQGNFWSLMLFVLSIAVGLIYLATGGLVATFEEAVIQFYRSRYLRDILQKPMSFFDASENATGSLLSRLAVNPDTVNSFVGPNLGVIVTVAMQFVDSVAIAIAFGWKLALVATFGALPPIFAAALIRERMVESFEGKAAKAFEKSNVFAIECMQAIKTVHKLSMEGVVGSIFKEMLQKHEIEHTKHAAYSMIWFALSESVDLPCMAITFCLATRPNWRLSMSSSSSSSNSDTSSTPLIDFQNVSFAYPSARSHPILGDFNLTLRQGETIAVVGPSGCGKSTIISLIEQFYPLTSGRLLINGIDTTSRTIQDDPTPIRAQISLVSQEPVLFSGSIKENIILGCSSPSSSSAGEPVDDTRLDEIAHQAQIHDLIKSLPEGWDTQVASSGGSGSGVALSGGQKQRIAIARALARPSKILLLDEATSALDGQSEELVQKALFEADHGAKNGGRGILIIARRLQTVRAADCIYVLGEGGVLREKGGHEELLAKGEAGVYREMCRMQGLI